MTEQTPFANFQKSVAADASPPDGLADCLKALWLDARGDWEGAHRVAQGVPDEDGAWVHAYLHRKEGDEMNAAYWYSRAGRPMAGGPLEREWEAIASELLKR